MDEPLLTGEEDLLIDEDEAKELNTDALSGEPPAEWDLASFCGDSMDDELLPGGLPELARYTAAAATTLLSRAFREDDTLPMEGFFVPELVLRVAEAQERGRTPEGRVRHAAHTFLTFAGFPPMPFLGLLFGRCESLGDGRFLVETRWATYNGSINGITTPPSQYHVDWVVDPQQDPQVLAYAGGNAQRAVWLLGEEPDDEIAGDLVPLLRDTMPV